MPEEPVAGPVLDFDAHLPAGKQWFTVQHLADDWGLSVQHVADLVTEGRFTFDEVGPVNFGGRPGQARATTRVPRGCVLAFLRANRQ